MVSRFYPSKSEVSVASTLDNPTMMSQHPRRKLPRGNPRKGKHAEVDKPAAPKATEPPSSNRLLAGYLAHEFLTKGTLLGQKFEFDLTRSGVAEPKREQDNYKEVANLLRTKGTHVKGIVNPTQLFNWINKATFKAAYWEIMDGMLFR